MDETLSDVLTQRSKAFWYSPHAKLIIANPTKGNRYLVVDVNEEAEELIGLTAEQIAHTPLTIPHLLECITHTPIDKEMETHVTALHVMLGEDRAPGVFSELVEYTVDGKRHFLNFCLKVIPGDPRSHICIEDVTPLYQKILELEENARFDPLVTNLLNRRHFMQQLEKIIKGNIGVCLVIIDLDDFKPINDNYGHDMGDRFLIELGVLLKKYMPKGSLIARLGGDEFAIALTHYQHKKVIDLLSKVTRQIQRIRIPGVHRRVSSSIGYAEWNPHTEPLTKVRTQGVNDVFTTWLNTLVRHADTAMYDAKRHGKNRVTKYESWMDDDEELKKIPKIVRSA